MFNHKHIRGVILAVWLGATPAVAMEYLSRAVAFIMLQHLPDSSPATPVLTHPLGSFAGVPAELYQEIFGYLEFHDLMMAMMVCRPWEQQVCTYLENNAGTFSDQIPDLRSTEMRANLGYVARLMHQSGNPEFFIQYMLTPIPGLDGLTPLRDLVDVYFGSYEKLYKSGYLRDVFNPEDVSAYHAAMAKIAERDALVKTQPPYVSNQIGYKTLRFLEYGDGLKHVYDEKQNKYILEGKFANHQPLAIVPWWYQPVNGWQRLQPLVAEYWKPSPRAFYSPSSLLKEYSYWEVKNPRLVQLLAHKRPPRLMSLEIQVMLSAVPAWVVDYGVNLAALELKGTGLMTLPQDFSKLQGLTELVLKSNLFRQIPQILSTLTQLQKLSFEDNPLDHLGRSARHLSTLGMLEELNLCNCRITNTEFFYDLHSLPSLGSISLIRNHLRAFPTFEQLQGLTELSLLNLAWNYIQFIPPWVKDWKKNRHQLTIWLDHNYVPLQTEVSFWQDPITFVQCWRTGEKLPTSVYNDDIKVDT
jgi:Leucine-rich repeat (LRR) protein